MRQVRRSLWTATKVGEVKPGHLNSLDLSITGRRRASGSCLDTTIQQSWLGRKSRTTFGVLQVLRSERGRSNLQGQETSLKQFPDLEILRIHAIWHTRGYECKTGRFTKTVERVNGAWWMHAGWLFVVARPYSTTENVSEQVVSPQSQNVTVHIANRK